MSPSVYIVDDEMKRQKTSIIQEWLRDTYMESQRPELFDNKVRRSQCELVACGLTSWINVGYLLENLTSYLSANAQQDSFV